MLSINLLDVYSIRQMSLNKEVIIFSPKGRNDNIEALFYNIGIEKILYMGCDGEDVSLSEAVCRKGSVFIWITDSIQSRVQEKQLREKGFVYLIDYNYLEGAHFQTRFKISTGLDANLGHGTVSDNEYGVRIWGGSGNKKIAVIGASLVDETFFSWRLWPRLLFDRLSRENYSYQFLLGGCYAYTTSQVYIKHLRDVIPCCPQIVIDYLPWENDCYYGLDIAGPFVIGFQKKEMTLLQNKTRMPFPHRYLISKIQSGNTTKQRTSQIILDNIRRSYELCTGDGIKYLCVIPPSITFQKTDDIVDKELKWAFEKKSIVIKEIWEEIKKGITPEMREYVVIGHEWLDGYPGIFYDQFHMYENGNQIVANKIYNVLKNEKKYI